jgi:tetratricopeptide (TPR) repeat protein
MAARYDALLLALILVTGLAAYFNSFGTELALEARTLLPNDSRIRSFDQITEIFDKNYGYPLITNDGLYRPLTTLSFLFNHTILRNGTNPIGYHAVNWALHALNTCMVFYLVTVIFRSTRAGFAAGLIFVCHPVNTEAVTHVMGRADLLAAFLVLLGLFTHIGSVARGGRGGTAWLLRLTMWLLFFLAMLAKESGVILLPLVMLFDWLFDWRRYSGRAPRDFWENMVRKLRSNYFWMLLVLLSYLAMRTVMLMRLEPRSVAFLDNPLADANLLSRLLTAPKIILKAAYLLIFPRSLTVDYSFNQLPAIDAGFHQLEDWFGVLALLGVCAIFWLAWHGRRRWRPMTFWLGLFLLALAPCCSLFVAAPTIFSERWLYLPTVAACAIYGLLIHLATRAIIAPWWAFNGQLPPFADVSETSLAQEHLDSVYIRKLAVRKRLGWFFYGFLIALLAGVFATRTVLRNYEWASELSLWRSAAVASPNSAKAHKQFAWASYQAAPDGSHIDESIAGTQKAILILADYEDAHAHLGHYYGVKADVMAAHDRAAGKDLRAETIAVYVDAARKLQKASELNRRSSEERLKRLRSRSWAGDLKLQLGNPIIYVDLGTVYAQLRQFDPALKAFMEACRLAPAEPTAHEGAGESLANMGKLDDSAVQFLQALLLDSNRTRPWSALSIVYQKLAPKEQPITRDARGAPRLNTSSPLVQGHIERAFRSLVQSLLDANQRDAARTLATIAVDQYGMPQADFGDLVRKEIQRQKVLIR